MDFVGLVDCVRRYWRPLGSIRQPLKTRGGLVSGVAGKRPDITVFKGIPFAAPPVGNLRWAAPKPAAPWTGVLKADKFSASCIQSVVEERKPWTHEFMTHGEISEDCLYLNVWTAAKSASEKRPVFVYIYGGGFNEGSGAVPVYDGEGLASKGLVVVTFNYRVGILGFFTHPELTADRSIMPAATTDCSTRWPRSSGYTITSRLSAAIQIASPSPDSRRGQQRARADRVAAGERTFPARD